jgi:ParB family transcriptional regulator, chromosome partitioning protein
VTVAPLKRRALGRGLGALIPGGEDATPTVRSPRDYFVAPIEEIHPTPDQPRQHFDDAKLEELAASIRTEGVLQPLVVRRRDEGGYWLIAGERRWRASQRAGLKEIPVVVRDVAEAQAFEMALVENIQRADLDPLEEAEAYRRLLDDHGHTQEELAARVGKDRTTIANAVRLLRLPVPVQVMVHGGTLSMGHARALLAVDDTAELEQLARTVVQKGLSVRATEALVRKLKAPATPAAKPSASVRDVEERLMRCLGAKVRLRDRGQNRGGSIEIDYANLDDLDRILDQLEGRART